MCNAEIKLYSELYKLYAEAKEVGINKRNVLPINTATRLVITTNIREWMYIIQRRCGPGDSVYTHVFALLVYEWFEKHYPKILSAFNAWYEKHPL